MKTSLHSEPTVFVIFGAGGDLASRKMVPALYNLFLDGWMPREYQILGVGHGEMNEEDYRAHLRKGVDNFSRRGRAEKDSWDDFASHVSFVSAELGESKAYQDMAKRLSVLDKDWKIRANHVFYLALQPSLIGDVVKGLAAAKLNRGPARIVVEKPFGSDLSSARELNHLLQILCLVAMEAPISLDADEVRNKKVDVLHAVRTILPERVHQHAVSGQYGPGWIEGKHVKGYRSEPRVAGDSSTETFAALRLFIDNWRWQGVPFYMRTGKRLSAKISEISIQFRAVSHQTFPPAALRDWHPNRLILSIQPEEGVFLRFQSKYPGQAMRLSPVMMQFYYRETFDVSPPDAYETLLLDVMIGDVTLFMRGDQAEAAWSVISPVLQVWNMSRPTDFPNYQAGTWGPEEADNLIAQDGYNWMSPTYLQCQDETATCRVSMEPRS